MNVECEWAARLEQIGLGGDPQFFPPYRPRCLGQNNAGRRESRGQLLRFNPLPEDVLRPRYGRREAVPESHLTPARPMPRAPQRTHNWRMELPVSGQLTVGELGRAAADSRRPAAMIGANSAASEQRGAGSGFLLLGHWCSRRRFAILAR